MANALLLLTAAARTKWWCIALVSFVVVVIGCGRKRSDESPATNARASARAPEWDSTPGVSPAPGEEPVVAPAVAPTPVVDAGADATDTWRDYRGTLGDKTSIEMFLERQGSSLSGSYRYVVVGKDLLLTGRAKPDGTIHLTEQVDRKETGSFQLRPDPDGGLVGTWTDASGATVLPAKLTPRGVPPAGRAAFLAFLTRLERAEKKAPLPLAQLQSTIVGTERFWIPEDREDALLKHGVYFGVATLYVADVNNDGKPDMVFVDMNTVSTHNDQLRGVYDAEGQGLRELPFADVASRSLYDGGDLGPNFPLYRDHPFIESTSRGVVMRMRNLWGVDAHGDVVRMIDPCDRMFDERFVFLWKGDRVDVIEHTRKYSACR